MWDFLVVSWKKTWGKRDKEEDYHCQADDRNGEGRVKAAEAEDQDDQGWHFGRAPTQ